jgi:hypothetical protein
MRHARDAVAPGLAGHGVASHGRRRSKVSEVQIELPGAGDGDGEGAADKDETSYLALVG